MPTTELGPLDPPRRWDPLGQNVRLEHSKTFWPLGFRLDVETNDGRALELVERAFPGAPGRGMPRPYWTLRIVVGAGEACAAQPVYRACGRLLSLAADARHTLAADMEAGEAVLWTARASMDDPARFARWWVAGPVLQMLSHRALTPVHAACVALGGRGLLLCGPPGAGKSVLAWAAAEAGLAFVSDDVSYLLRDEPDRVLGRPELLRLKPSAAKLVTALGRFEPVPDDAPGEWVYELAPERDLGLAAAPECRAAGVVLLERRLQGTPELAGASADEVFALLDATLPAASPAVTPQQTAALRTLAQGPCRRLRYSAAPEAARALRQLLRSPSETIGE